MVLAEDLGYQHTHGGSNHPNSSSQDPLLTSQAPGMQMLHIQAKHACAYVCVIYIHTDTQIFGMLSRTPFKILNEKRHIVV